MTKEDDELEDAHCKYKLKPYVYYYLKKKENENFVDKLKYNKVLANFYYNIIEKIKQDYSDNLYDQDSIAEILDSYSFDIVSVIKNIN